MAKASVKKKWTAEEVQQWYCDAKILIYCNPSDSNIVVKKARRKGFAVNWANPKAYLLLGAVLALVFVIVLLLK